MENKNPQEPQPKHHGRNVGKIVTYLFIISGFMFAFTNAVTIPLNAGWIPKLSFYSGDPKLILGWIAVAALMLAAVGLYVTIYYAFAKKDRLSGIFPEMKPVSVLDTKIWYAFLIALNALMGTTYQNPLQYTWVLLGLAFAYIRFSINEYIRSQGNSDAVE